METKFTKGNWYPVQYGPYFNIQDDEYYDTGLNLLNADEIDSNEAAANALLASKAPLLFEELNNAIQYIHKLEWPSNMQETLFNFCANAEQLIMDATNI